MSYLVAFAFLTFVLATCAFAIMMVDANGPDLPEEESMTSDLAIVRVELSQHIAEIEREKANAVFYVVNSEESFVFAHEVIKRVKRVVRSAVDRKDAYMKPLRALIKLVTEETQPIINGGDEIERILEAKCLAWKTEAVRVRAEAEAKARALLPSAPPAERRAAVVAVAQAIAPKVQGVSYRDNWHARVEDQSKVPERYWIRVVSQALIDAEMITQITAAKAKGDTPAPSIDGVKITNDVITVHRT